MEAVCEDGVPAGAARGLLLRLDAVRWVWSLYVSAEISRSDHWPSLPTPTQLTDQRHEPPGAFLPFATFALAGERALGIPGAPELVRPLSCNGGPASLGRNGKRKSKQLEACAVPRRGAVGRFE
jgi:hypothetical protein